MKTLPKDLPKDARRARQILARLAHVGFVDDGSLEELRGLGEDGLQSLADACESPSLPMRRVAATAIARLATRSSLATLLNAIPHLEGEDDVVTSLLDRATELFEPKDRDRVWTFLERLDDGASPAVSDAIRRAFGALSGPTESMGLRVDVDFRMGGAPTGLAENTATVPRAASMNLIQALGARSESERREARSSLLRHPDRDRIVTEHLHHPDANVRRSVLEVAAVAGIASLRRALFDIAHEASRPDNERALALRGITGTAAEGFEQQVVEAHFHDRDLYVRAEALRLGASSANDRLINVALGSMAHEEPWVRKRVAEGWASIASGSRQHDMSLVLTALSEDSWLTSGLSLDIDAFQALAGGIIRFVELGGQIDPHTRRRLEHLREGYPVDIRHLASQLVNTLDQM